MSYGCSAHNAQFDFQFLFKYGIFPKLNNDPMLLSYAMDESPSHPLKRLSRRVLGMEDWSLELEKYPDKTISYAYIPEKVLLPYCGMDTASAKLLTNQLWEKADKDERRLYTNILMPCAEMFAHVNYEGIPIDLKRLMELRKQWLNERLEMIQELKDFGVKNINSPYQVSDALNKVEAVDYEAVTLKSNLGKIARQCRESGNEKGARLCELVVNCRELGKAVDTVLYDVASSIGSDGKIHPDAKQFATVTGRLAYGNPSLLNYPRATRLARELRTVFIPPPGYIWGHRDQKQFEYRVYTAIMNDPGFRAIFNEGIELSEEDIGILVSRGIDVEEFKRDPHGVFTIRHFKGDIVKYLEEQKKRDIRGIMKTVGFGKLYGRGWETVASQLNIPDEEAEELMDFIGDTIVTLKEYQDWIEHSYNVDQVLINPLGRKRRFPIITEENYHEGLLQAYNFPIQSTANDCNLMGMNEMYRSEYKDLLKPMFPIHDAIEYLEDEKHSDEIEDWIEHTLADIPATVLKVTNLEFKTDGGLGTNWAEASMPL